MDYELRVKLPKGFQWGGVARGDAVLMVDKARDLVARFDLVNGYRLFKNYAAGADKWTEIGIYATAEELEKDLECNRALLCNLFAGAVPCICRSCGLCRYFDKDAGECRQGVFASSKEENARRLLELGFRKVSSKEDRYFKVVDASAGLEIHVTAYLDFLGWNCVSVEIKDEAAAISLTRERGEFFKRAEAPSNGGIDGLLQRAREEAGQYLKEIAAKVAEAFGNGKAEGEEGDGKDI